MSIARREFLASGALPALASVMSAYAAEKTDTAVQDRTVNFRADGLALSPADYARLLGRLAEHPGIEVDYYSRDGVVATLEEQMAKLLGKEMAVYLPTGTLANHLAVRLLAGNRRRVLVQHESHLYNDAGDCAQRLSGLTLVPSGCWEGDIYVGTSGFRGPTRCNRASPYGWSERSPLNCRFGVLPANSSTWRRCRELANMRERGASDCTWMAPACFSLLLTPAPHPRPMPSSLTLSTFLSTNVSTQPPARSSRVRARCWKTFIMTAECSAPAWRRFGGSLQWRCIIWTDLSIALRVPFRSPRRSSMRLPRTLAPAWSGGRMEPTWRVCGWKAQMPHHCRNACGLGN